MKRLVFSLAFLLSGAGAAPAQVYEHNSSVMKVDVSGKQVEIKYLSPRPGLPLNVQLGTVLFEGGVNERSGRIEGNAYAFRAGCKPVPYWVVGDFVEGDKYLVLSGARPVIDRRTCTIVGTGDASRLVFTIDREPY